MAGGRRASGQPVHPWNHVSFNVSGRSGRRPRHLTRLFEIAKEQQPRLQTVAIVDADIDFAKKAADGACDNAIALGFWIVHERSYPPATIDFTPIMRAVQAANPDFVYIASWPGKRGA